MNVPPVYERHATVERVVDGDTLHLTVSLGCDVYTAMTVRVYGVNAPEMSTPEGKAAKAWVETWVKQRALGGFVVRTVRDRREKYGRYLADLLPLDGGASLAQSLLSTGHAVEYLP